MIASTIFPQATLDHDRMQWEDYLDRFTPIEDRGGLLYKREDFFAPLGYGGANGSKLRQLIYLVNRYVEEGGDAGVLTGASVLSPQLSMAALVARHYGLPTTIVLGATKPESAIRHENIAIAAAAGAEFIFTPVGFNPAIQRKVAELHRTAGLQDHYRLCYGITTPAEADAGAIEAFHAVGALQVKNVPAEARTIVMTAGSCNSCTSVLYGIAKYRPPGLERIILLGIGPTRLQFIESRLQAIETVVGLPIRNLFRRVYWHHAALEEEHQTDGPIVLEHHDLHATGFATYQDRMPFRVDGIDFHPTYEGKMMSYMHQHASTWFGWLNERAGDTLIWIVGSAPSRAAMQDAFLLEGIRA